MITRIYARNYRSIGEINIDLGALTALVGPNASGKSNIADVLRFFSDCINTSLRQAVALRQGLGVLRRWSAGRPLDVEIGVAVQNEKGSGAWELTLASGSDEDTFFLRREFAVWSEHRFEHTQQESTSESAWAGKLFLGHELSTMAPLIEEISRFAVYSLFPDVLRSPQSPDPTKPMLARGDNWASALKGLDKERWGGEILAGLGRIAGDIDEFRVTQTGGFLIPEFRHGVDGTGRERWLGAAQESDGTLRVAAILTALFQEPSPSLIGFEEPEIAVHPGAIPVLFDFLSEASTRSQILLTTHSPDLLDLLSIDDIRVVERRAGATAVARVEERQRELVKKRLLSTSDVLHAEGLRPEGAANADARPTGAEGAGDDG